MRTAILFSLVAGSCVAAAPGKDKDPPKPHPLVGEWQIVSQTQNGKESRWTLDETVFAFTADGKYAEFRDGRREKVTWVQYRTDDKADPPTLDIIHAADDKGAGLTVRWLFRIDGETLSICSFENRTIRPKEFEAGTGSRNLIFKLSRVKPKK
jgi:uncharacterized protein (TIGR03067 family)